MNTNKDQLQKRKNSKWYFMALVLLLYASVYFYAPDKLMPILVSFIKLLGQILPIFLIVYIVMVLTNFFIDNKKLKKIMGDDAGIKAWTIAIIAGIISAGSIYIWYPLLKDLQQKGVKEKFIVTFLYNRGIKLQWLPILFLYFGWRYSLVLFIVMTVLSVFQGIITEKLINTCCISASKATSSE